MARASPATGSRYEGQTLFVDPYLSRVPFRDLLLRRPACPSRPPSTALSARPARSSACSSATPTSTTRSTRPRSPAASAARPTARTRCVNLMALHGLAEPAVEVEPYRTYELGPFEVSFTPSVHSKLLLGLAVPYDGELTCEHLDALSPGAYRCGQVWGISIEVAGIRFYHQGSANLIDDAVRERGVDVFLAGVAGRSFTRDYWQRILPRLDPRVVVPTHYDNFFRPLGSPMEFVANVQVSRAPGGDRRGQRATSSSRRCPAPTCSGQPLAAVLGGDLLDRAHRPIVSGPSDGLDRLQVELGFEHARRSAASRARGPRSPGGPRRLASASACLASPRARRLWQQRDLQLALRGLRPAPRRTALRGDRPISSSLRRKTGTS